jgi:hypothetical protein
MISIKATGSTKRTSNFLSKLRSNDPYSDLTGLASRGVAALQAATPTDTGVTGASWSYQIEKSGGSVTITWLNSHVVNGVNIAVILQYGHGTGTGGYVAGRDYINPAIQGVMDDIANEVWKKVTDG